MDEFISYIKEVLELDESNKIEKLNELSSNFMLIVTDSDKKYIIKNYYSDLLFNTELFILLNYININLKTPQILYYEKKEKAGWNWIVYKYISGDSLFKLKGTLTLKQFSDIFFETGKILNLFHHLVKTDEYAEYCSIQTVNIINKTESNYSTLKDKMNHPLFLKAITYMRSNYLLLNDRNDYTFIIKDFNDKHILLVKKLQYEISGIIDFEMTCFSNKFYDFILLYISYFLDNQMQEKYFLEGYGICLNTMNRKKIAFFILDYALELCSTLKDIHRENEKTGMKIINKVFNWLNRGI